MGAIQTRSHADGIHYRWSFRSSSDGVVGSLRREARPEYDMACVRHGTTGSVSWLDLRQRASGGAGRRVRTPRIPGARDAAAIRIGDRLRRSGPLRAVRQSYAGHVPGSAMGSGTQSQSQAQLGRFSFASRVFPPAGGVGGADEMEGETHEDTLSSRLSISSAHARSFSGLEGGYAGTEARHLVDIGWARGAGNNRGGAQRGKGGAIEIANGDGEREQTGEKSAMRLEVEVETQSLARSGL